MDDFDSLCSIREGIATGTISREASKESVHLVYVALTRARRKLIMNSELARFIDRISGNGVCIEMNRISAETLEAAREQPSICGWCRHRVRNTARLIDFLTFDFLTWSRRGASR